MAERARRAFQHGPAEGCLVAASLRYDNHGQLALRAITGLMALAAILCSLGCAGGDSNAGQGSGASREAAAPTSSTETRAAAKEPAVTKEYFEDIIGDPEEPEEEYRYWDYRFDFGNRQYLARIYTDEPDVAYVDRIDEGGGADEVSVDGDDVTVDLGGDAAIQRQDPAERANLRRILRHLTQDGWPKIVIHTIVGDTGYKPLQLR